MTNFNFMAFAPGILILAITAIIKLLPPLKPNSWYGFRTTLSMRNQETWEEANSFSANRMLQAGLILIVIGLVVQPLGKIGQELVPVFCLLPLLAWMIISTEKHLKQIFDKNGKRTGKEQDGRAIGRSVNNQLTSEVQSTPALKGSFLLAMMMILFVSIIGWIWFDRFPDQINIHFDLLGNPSSSTIARQTGFVVAEAILLFAAVATVFMYYMLKRTYVNQNGMLPFVIFVPFSLAVSAVVFRMFYFNIYGKFPVRPIDIVIVSLGLAVIPLVVLRTLSRRI